MSIATKWSYGLVGLAALASFAVVPLSMAAPGHRGDAKPTNVMVNINPGGKVEVRGATVGTVSGNTFTATTTWGSTTLNWTIVVSSTTQVTDKDGRDGKKGGGKHKPFDIDHVVAGDVVDFMGQLDATSSSLKVLARVVNDRSAVVVPLPKVKDVFQGRLQSIVSTTTLPTNLSLKIGKDTFTVHIPTGTPILKSDFTATSLSLFEVGDMVRVYGSINASSTMIDALVVRNASL